jgi:hypothetical protein
MARKAPSHCAPVRFEHAKRTGTCLTPAEVIRVASVVAPAAVWPAKAKAKAKAMTGATAATTNAADPWSASATQLASQLMMERVHQALGTRRGEEEMWLNAAPIRRDGALRAQLANAFRPPRPRAWLTDPKHWLSTMDILAVLKQYEISHGKSHGFRFVGVFPVDFAANANANANAKGRTNTGASANAKGNTKGNTGATCVSQDMCDLTVSLMRNAGVRNAAMVFNMDSHKQPGSHWTACYIGLDPALPQRFGVWYYDSVARPPPQEIAAFMQRIKTEADERIKTEADAAWGGNVRGMEFQYKFNPPESRKQFQNTECGIFACFFIVACLSTTLTYDAISKQLMANDGVIHTLRDVFFGGPVAAPNAVG